MPLALRRGTSMVELLVVLAILGILSSIAIPRMRPSTRAIVEQNARLLSQDLDLARTRAYSSRARVRVVFTDTIWQMHLDQDRDGTIAEVSAERTAFGSLYSHIVTKNVVFGRGVAPKLPSDPLSTVPTGVRRLNFDARGTTDPFGTTMVFYLTHSTDAASVYAVEISPSANIRVWRWLNGVWQ
jgi:prepilin-type N-terminal cleavage/methylation domain-containing protein